MTNEQIAWLKKNPQYRPIGVAPGMHVWRHRGTLCVDGTFVPWSPQSPVLNSGGAFGVGILEPIQGGGIQGGGLQSQAAAGRADVAPENSGSPPAGPPGPLPRKV